MNPTRRHPRSTCAPRVPAARRGARAALPRAWSNPHHRRERPLGQAGRGAHGARMSDPDIVEKGGERVIALNRHAAVPHPGQFLARHPIPLTPALSPMGRGSRLEYLVASYGSVEGRGRIERKHLPPLVPTGRGGRLEYLTASYRSVEGRGRIEREHLLPLGPDGARGQARVFGRFLRIRRRSETHRA